VKQTEYRTFNANKKLPDPDKIDFTVKRSGSAQQGQS
jgi:hypothetical protein